MSLRDETNKLKNAIITISQAATRDGTTLSQAIQSAQQLIATEESETNAIQPDSRAYHDDTSPVGIEYLPEDDGNDAELFRRITTVEHDEPQQNHSDTLGDFLSLHADRHITITSAPADIAPFLGAAAYSVAGQIHWVAMAYNYAAVKALRNADVSTEAYGQAARTFGPALRKISVDNLLGILQSRLVYRQNGVMTGVGHPARDPSLGKKLMMSLIKQSAPTPKKPYLTAFAVADRLRACLGSGFVDFEDILSSGSVDFRTPIMKATMKDLASKAIVSIFRCHLLLVLAGTTSNGDTACFKIVTSETDSSAPQDSPRCLHEAFC